MANDTLKSGRLCQIAFVVSDIEKTAKAWAAALGQEPDWYTTEGQDQTHARYHGKPTDARARLAFFRLGAVDIELIQPIDDAPSTWRDSLGDDEVKIHHLGFGFENSDAVEQHLVSQGMKVVHTGDFTGGKYVYVDAMKTLGTIVELLAKRP